MPFGGYTGLSTGREKGGENISLTTLRPHDGKRHNTLVVEVIHGESGVTEQKVFLKSLDVCARATRIAA
jgi:hypothetical protein